MGITDWQRQYLSNFEVVAKQGVPSFQYVDHRCNVLFNSLINYDNKSAALAEFKTLAANATNFDSFDCPEDCAFGIRLLNEAGEIIALHPIIYPTKAKRDAAKETLRKLIVSEGLIIEKEEKAASWKILLRDKKQIEFLESISVFENKTAAWADWIKLLNAAKKANNFEVIPNEIGGGYLFILTDIIDSQKLAIAKSSKIWSTKALATRQKNKAIQYFQKTGLPPQIQQEAPTYGWTILDNLGNDCLKGFQTLAIENEAEKKAVYHFFQNT